MSVKIVNEKLIVNYLLGNLAEEERAELEESFFRDAEYREIIYSIEDDLIDDYVRGELSARERVLFEEQFVALPHRRRKVELARALANTLAEGEVPHAVIADAETSKKEARNSWLTKLAILLPRDRTWRWALTAAALLLLIGGAWWVINRSMVRREGLRVEERPQENQPQPAGSPAPNEERAGQLPSKEGQRESQGTEQAAAKPSVPQSEEPGKRQKIPPLPPASVASFILSPGTARSETPSVKLIVPRSTGFVRVRLDLEKGDDYPNYRADLRTAGGKLVSSRGQLRVQRFGARRAVVLNFPRATFKPGEYEFILSGVRGDQQPEELGSYFFSIQKQ